jgi:DnaJ-class molecular chaperone
MMAQSKKKLLSEYEAACITGMSPELLRWLTSNAPKSGIKRKLKVADVQGQTYFFEEDELLDFNDWLKKPWPHKDGKRPHVPAGIRREIINEANGECAICHGHKDTCEAAHLDPIHKSQNNHPENLLWLCSNHHTAYDDGLFGPDEENAEFVVDFKRLLHRYKLMLWRTQHEISHKLLTILEDCNGLAKHLKASKTEAQIKAVEKIAAATLDQLPILAPVSKKDPKYAAYKSISADIASLAKSGDTVSTRLEKAHDLREEYVAAFGFIPCPLCKGSGRHEGTDCPVCNGDREIEEHFAERIDLSDYNKVDCPLCKGAGNFEGDVCPVCGGDAEMDRRYADRVDVSDYQKVDCPLCNGTTKHKERDCPVCGGNGELDRRHSAQVDLREFEDVNCPLCEGKGRYEERDCPECGGEGEMERRFADQVDLRDYSKVDCPVCEGKGRRFGDECPACSGEAKIDRRDLDKIDVREYQLVKCPVCKGTRHYRGDDCRACGGEGEMERRHANAIDPKEYDA